MSLLDDARQLAEFDTCWICMDGPRRHLDDCPMRSMPKIVKALEAVSSVLDRAPLYWYMMGGGDYRRCRFCGQGVGYHDDDGTWHPNPRLHTEECPWQALVGAMRGTDA